MKQKAEVSTFKLFIRLLKILWANDKMHTLASVTLCVVVGLATAAGTPVKQYFFEAAEHLSDNHKLGLVIGVGIFWGVLTLITLLLQGASDLMIEDLGVRLGGSLGKLVNGKAARLEPVCYEDSTVLDSVNQAYKGVEQSGGIIQLLITLSAFYIPYFMFLSVYIYRIHPALCAGILLVLLPTLGGQYLLTRYYDKLENKAAPLRREMEYYQACIADREYAKETRLFGAVFFFRELHKISTLLFQKESWKTERKSSLVELGFRLLSLLVYIVILGLMYRHLKMGFLGTAAFAAIFTSIDQMFNYMDYVGYYIGNISQFLPTVNNTLNFMSLPERKGKTVELPHCGIEFDHVSFAYPGNEKMVLNDLNLSIKEGETIAVVGENGAGKSTFAKLLLGLYLPKEGDVSIGGFSTREISPDVFFQKVSGVFQNFQRYKMTLKENIKISDPVHIQEEDRLRQVVKEVNLEEKSKGLQNGIDTMLAREFGGTDLSGGQWQRIAIGRGLYREHDLIVLDEPTASIDPLEESRVYHQFAELSKGKTAIIITHRIGSARLADRIVVMGAGTIAGVGTHEELLRENGTYRGMFQAQAQWYQ
jgi:ATP-binding cassette subfamily B protein